MASEVQIVAAASGWVIAQRDIPQTVTVTAPTEAIPGDLLVVVARSGTAASNGGSSGTATFSSGGIELSTAVSDTENQMTWEWSPNRKRRLEWYYSDRVTIAYAAITNTDTLPSVTARATATGASGAGSVNLDLLIVRDSGGVGAVRRGVWGLAATPASLALAAWHLGPATAPGPWEALDLGGLRNKIATADAGGDYTGTTGTHTPLAVVELLPPAPPEPPLLVAPGEGTEVSWSQEVQLAWAHQPTRPRGGQSGVRLEVTVGEEGGVPVYWDGDGFGPAETDVATARNNLTLTPSTDLGITESSVFAWTAATQERIDNSWSDYNPTPGVVVVVEPPAVTVTAPSGPVVDQLRVPVEWETDAEQVAARVRAVHETTGDVLYTGPWTNGGDLRELDIPANVAWDNGATYVPQVEIRQAGGATSGWVDGDPFTVSWTPPAAPVVSAAPGVHGVEVTVLDGEVAQARATLEAALGEEPVYSPDAPADTSRAWYNAGEVRRWVDYGPGPVTNLVTNPRGRRTSGTVTIRENLAHIADHAGGSGATVTLQPDGSLLSVGLDGGSNYVRIRSSAGFPLVEGEEYTASVYAKADDDLVSDADLMIQWYGPDGYMSPSPRGERVPVSQDGWTRIVSHGIVPEGATHYNLWVERKSARPGDRWMVRDVMFERGSEALPYFDGDTWDGDPDFTPEWDGTPGESTSRLVAPRPVGWSQSTVGVGYYSETFDSLAMVTTGEATYAHVGFGVGSHASATSVVEFLDVRPFAVFEARARWDYTQTDWARSLTAPVTIRSTEVDTSSNMLVQRNATEAGDTAYFRAAAVPGEYDGPYFDGHTFGVYWDGDPDDSTSTYPGPHWALVEDADVVAAAQALHAVEDTGLVEVERTTPNGDATIVQVPAGHTFIDVTAPYGQTSTYRGRVFADLDGQLIPSPWTAPAQAVNRDRFSYLIDPEDPQRWVRFKQAYAPRTTHQRDVQVNAGLGASRDMVDMGPYRGRRGTLTVRTDTLEEAEALVAMLHESRTWTVRMPAVRQGPEWVDGGAFTFAIAGELDEDWLADTVLIAKRTIPIPYVEQ